MNNERTQKAVAVMTSGGDAPGMNANVRAIVRTVINRGARAYCVMEGYEGLVKGGPEYIKECNWEFVRGWLSEGGTNIGTARCMEFRQREGRLTACKNLIDAGIDALIVCGGDGSLTGADLFRSEWPSLIKELLDTDKISEELYNRYKHLNICGTVGSIDNDMSTTDATIGAYSALDRICTAIDYIEATAYSHSRAFVVEVMGRNCGWLALMAGIATSADYIFIPEKPAQTNSWEDQMSEIVTRHRSNGKRTTIVIVSEGAIDSNLNPITCDDVHKVLSTRLNLDTRITILGHVQRGGTAVAHDRILSTLQGVEAVDAILESTPETPSPLIAINENKITRKPLMESVALTKSVADAIAAKDFEKAMSLRDVEFKDHLNNFMAINSSDKVLPKEVTDKGLNIGIINIGAPAGGMNSAVYSVTTYCLSQGHNALAIHNGFTGLVRHDSVHGLTWKQLIGWQSKGGSEIGTNRHTASEAGIEEVAAMFQKHKFDGLIIVGGFEALISLQELQEARKDYPAFRIPMVLIPATLSNNVPGTEYSLGADTALNSLMHYCDIIKQSASSTRARAFVVEVQGGNSGYLTTLAALACGAQISYVPEEGNISILQLEKDIENLKDSFKSAMGRDRFGKLVLKATNASLKTWDAHTLANVLTEEANGAFDAKAAIPGHVQQGGLPSPIDRTRGTRLAIKAVNFLEQFGKTSVSTNEVAKALYESKLGHTEYSESNDALELLIETASVLGTKGSQLQFTPIKTIYENESDLVNRMPKEIHWNHIRDIADELVGRERI